MDEQADEPVGLKTEHARRSKPVKAGNALDVVLWVLAAFAAYVLVMDVVRQRWWDMPINVFIIVLAMPALWTTYRKFRGFRFVGIVAALVASGPIGTAVEDGEAVAGCAAFTNTASSEIVRSSVDWYRFVDPSDPELREKPVRCRGQHVFAVELERRDGRKERCTIYKHPNYGNWVELESALLGGGCTY